MTPATHLVRITRTLTLRGTVTLEVPINITADQIRETLVEGNELEGLLTAGRLDMKPETEDWRAEYTQDLGQKVLPYSDVREALIGDELLSPLSADPAWAEVVAHGESSPSGVGPDTVTQVEPGTPAPSPAAKKTARKRGRK
jgi:hypothetical protein